MRIWGGVWDTEEEWGDGAVGVIQGDLFFLKSSSGDPRPQPELGIPGRGPASHIKALIDSLNRDELEDEPEHVDLCSGTELPGERVFIIVFTFLMVGFCLFFPDPFQLSC